MKLCVALDLPSKEENLMLVEQLLGLDLWLKVGLRSYLRDGNEFVARLQKMGFKIFLDLKLYDIPNTTADAAEVAADLGVDMLSIHASCGAEAMGEVMRRLSGRRERPLVMAISALTSFSQESFRQIYNAPLQESVVKFAKTAAAAGLDGIVSSVFESVALKAAAAEVLGGEVVGGEGQKVREFLTLTPGIRPFGEAADDQKRVATLQDALREKSDFIVIGRPIYKAQNPREVTQKILSVIKERGC